MYRAFEEALARHAVDAVIVDNYPPYHPDYLRRLPVFKVLRVADGPLCAYDRDFAYLHAYDHILYHSPAYSSDMEMSEKLRYCGAESMDFWPQAVFDAAFDHAKDGDVLERQTRDIDVLFIGVPMWAKCHSWAGSRRRSARGAACTACRPSSATCTSIFASASQAGFDPCSSRSMSRSTSAPRSGSMSITVATTRSGVTGSSNYRPMA